MGGMLRAMRRLSRVGMWAAAVVVAAGAAGCGGDDDGGGSGKDSKPTAASSSAAPAMSVDDALAAYQAVDEGGCTDAPSCQELMTAKLRAAKKLRIALSAEDPAAYAEPVRLIRRARLPECKTRSSHPTSNICSPATMAAPAGRTA